MGQDEQEAMGQVATPEMRPTQTSTAAKAAKAVIRPNRFPSRLRSFMD